MLEKKAVNELPKTFYRSLHFLHISFGGNLMLQKGRNESLLVVTKIDDMPSPYRSTMSARTMPTSWRRKVTNWFFHHMRGIVWQARVVEFPNLAEPVLNVIHGEPSMGTACYTAFSSRENGGRRSCILHKNLPKCAILVTKRPGASPALGSITINCPDEFAGNCQEDELETLNHSWYTRKTTMIAGLKTEPDWRCISFNKLGGDFPLHCYVRLLECTRVSGWKWS